MPMPSPKPCHILFYLLMKWAINFHILQTDPDIMQCCNISMSKSESQFEILVRVSPSGRHGCIASFNLCVLGTPSRHRITTLSTISYWAHSRWANCQCHNAGCLTLRLVAGSESLQSIKASSETQAVLTTYHSQPPSKSKCLSTLFLSLHSPTILLLTETASVRCPSAISLCTKVNLTSMSAGKMESLAVGCV